MDGSDQSSDSTLKPLHQPNTPKPSTRHIPQHQGSRAKERGRNEARRGGRARGGQGQRRAGGRDLSSATGRASRTASRTAIAFIAAFIMPEYAELHDTAHICADASRGFVFSKATVDTRWSLPCSLKQEAHSGSSRDEVNTDEDGMNHVRPLPGTESWTHGFELCVRHRGKEVCIAARKCASPPEHPMGDIAASSTQQQHQQQQQRESWCPTCAAVANDDEGASPPKCSGHGDLCQLQTVRRQDSRHVGRRFWSCCRSSARERCSYFRWASPCQRAKEADFFPTSAADADGLLLVTFRRGMHGRCVLLTANEEEPYGVHLCFLRRDGARLCFVDSRVRTTSTGVWQFGLWGGAYRRSPDPVYEYDAFRQRALALLGSTSHQITPPLRDAAAVLAAPACELLLDQRLFNGVGNYLRAEILYRAKIRPFDSARVALERADGSSTDILRVTREVLSEAVEKKGRNWLNVYRKAYARHEVDGLGRAVWYRGERGPLPTTLYEAEGAWDSLFFARLPDALDKAALHALCTRFGPVAHVAYNVRRAYAFVRFEAVESAAAAVAALDKLRLFGSELHVRFKRRLRKLQAAAAEGKGDEEKEERDETASAADGVEELDEEIDEEDLMAEEEVEEVTHAHTGALPSRCGPPEPRGAAELAAAPAHQGQTVEDEEDDEDEWDEPVGSYTSPPMALSTPSKPPPDAFGRSIRSFRSAGALAGSGRGDSEAAGAAGTTGEGNEGSGLDFLRNMAKSLNQQAERELKRPRKRERVSEY